MTSEEEKSVGNGHCNHLALKFSVCVKERQDRLVLSVAWPIGVQLLVFFCSSVPVVLFDTPGISGRNTFLSSPHLCFIIVLICDLFVSRVDPLMS